MTTFIGIEAGGTKFVCTYGKGDGSLSDRIVIPTKDPVTTVSAVADYIRTVQAHTAVKAIGIGCFGPIDPDPSSVTYGFVTSTPKKSWRNFNIAGYFKQQFGLPIGFDTDVNAAALGEYYWGAAQGLSDFLYCTVGTGIGVGAVINGKLLHGAMHSEMGHISIPQHPDDDFAGVCDYHGACLEGLASGPALKARWQVESATDLPPDHPAWELEAHYLAVACATYTMCLSPKRIIIGGGVMKRTHLIDKIRPKLLEQLAGYINNSTVVEGINCYQVAPGLGVDSGIHGTLALAKRAYESTSQKLKQNCDNKVGVTYDKPWGNYKTLALSDTFQAKILTINPGQSLSLQKHFQRSEHWVVVTGQPTVTVAEDTRQLQRDQHIYIPLEAFHRIANNSDKICQIVEVQVGDYLGEDDIERIEDQYGRIEDQDKRTT